MEFKYISTIVVSLYRCVIISQGGRGEGDLKKNLSSKRNISYKYVFSTLHKLSNQKNSLATKSTNTYVLLMLKLKCLDTTLLRLEALLSHCNCMNPSWDEILIFIPALSTSQTHFSARRQTNIVSLNNFIFKIL